VTSSSVLVRDSGASASPVEELLRRRVDPVQVLDDQRGGRQAATRLQHAFERVSNPRAEQLGIERPHRRRRSAEQVEEVREHLALRDAEHVERARELHLSAVLAFGDPERRAQDLDEWKERRGPALAGAVAPEERGLVRRHARRELVEQP